MILRDATLDDAKVLFEWANDPLVREASLDTAPIKWADHLTWLEIKLADPGALLLVADNVGYVRFQREDSVVVVSISVASQSRGKGLGKQLLQSGMDRAAAKWEFKEFHAVIKDFNQASIRLFESCGYELYEREGGRFHYRKVLPLEVSTR